MQIAATNKANLDAGLDAFGVDVEQLVRDELQRNRGRRIVDALAAATIFAAIFITGGCAFLFLDAYHAAETIGRIASVN